MNKRPNLLPLPADVELRSWMWPILILAWKAKFGGKA